MRDIYQQASQVTIWLGEEDDETEMGMSMIKKLESIQDEFADHQRLKTLTPDRASELGIPMFGETSKNLENWQSFSSILARPWFRRVWVGLFGAYYPFWTVPRVFTAPETCLVS